MFEFLACKVPVREHQASGARRESEPVVSRLWSFFARWQKIERIRSNYARKMAKNNGAKPSVTSLDMCGSDMSRTENTSPPLFMPAVSPCAITRPWEQDASPNPRFLASGPSHSLAETRKKPRCIRNESNTDGAKPSVASLNFSVCNFPLWEHQFSALWACSVPLRNTRPREHNASPNPRLLASWSLGSLAHNPKKLL